MPQEFFGRPLLAAQSSPPAPASADQPVACRREESPLDEAAAKVGLAIHSAILREQAERVAMAAPTEAPILLLGETGVGKQLFAALAHALSLRAHRPLVPVNCGALVPNLIEDHLFGHVRGAFTDAKTGCEAAFETSGGAAIFLDEIGELSLEAQTRLLSVLGNGEVQRLGSNRVVKVDVRVIAATHRDLHAMVAANGARRFRTWPQRCSRTSTCAGKRPSSSRKNRSMQPLPSGSRTKAGEEAMPRKAISLWKSSLMNW